MRKIILLIVLAMLISPENTLSPPMGNCGVDEVNRCYMGSCMSTLMYCPPIFEDGVYIGSTCKNQTSCIWDCTCVKKSEVVR